MITKIKLFAGLLVASLVFSLSLYSISIKSELQKVKSENKLVVAALSQAQTDLTALRTQYLQIQEEVSYVATQKHQLEQRTATLQKALVKSQSDVPCSTVNVPDDVTQRLRERAAEVNAAATAARNATETVSNP